MRFLALVPALVTLSACAGSSGPDCGGTAPMLGTWEYHGLRTTPPPSATITGTLQVNSVDGCEFSGSLNTTETPDGGGPAVVHAGPIFGIAVSADAVNFDAQFTDEGTRTHVADVIADSLSGEWIEGSGTMAPRGTFWARRTP